MQINKCPHCATLYEVPTKTVFAVINQQGDDYEILQVFDLEEAAKHFMRSVRKDYDGYLFVKPTLY